MPDSSNTYFVTFGQGHSHTVHGIEVNSNTIAEISAPDDKASEIKARNYFGDKFATVEPADELAEGLFDLISGGIVRVDY